MVCTYCGANTQVINSRLQKRSNSVWRRRKCVACNAIFTTSEQVDYEKTWVVQYSAREVRPFMRDQLLVSIYNSLRHRASALADAEGLTNTVISMLTKQIQNGTLQARDIAAATHVVLNRFDQPGAISYQAFHADVL